MPLQTTNAELGQQIEYLYGLERFGIKPGLEVTQALLKELGNPENDFRSIHIAGTNGKGSTAAMLAGVLQAAGHQTGLYTSPHLWKFNERVQVDNQPIIDTDLSNLIEVVRSAASKAKLQPTFFEFTTALAFLYLARQRVDIAVIETGMGGLYDATNVINPIQSIITNITLDHTRYLGKTKHEIAARKAGIIKPDTPCITAEQDPVLLNYFANVCRANHAPLWRIDDHVTATVHMSSWEQQHVSVTGDFTGELALPLIGDHQVANLRTALTSLAELQRHGLSIDWSDIRQGIERLSWPGRLDIVSQDPFVLVDAAHNAASLSALAGVVADLPQRETLVVALAQDKDPSLLAELTQMFNRVIVTEGDHRPSPAKALARQLARYNSETSWQSQPERAFTDALTHNGATVITGSLYMIPRALKYFA